LDASGSIIIGAVIVNEGKVVRPSQLIASVRQLLEGRKGQELADRTEVAGCVNA
jgi:hypothetical protein